MLLRGCPFKFELCACSAGFADCAVSCYAGVICERSQKYSFHKLQLNRQVRRRVETAVSKFKDAAASGSRSSCHSVCSVRKLFTVFRLKIHEPE